MIKYAIIDFPISLKFLSSVPQTNSNSTRTSNDKTKCIVMFNTRSSVKLFENTPSFDKEELSKFLKDNPKDWDADYIPVIEKININNIITSDAVSPANGKRARLVGMFSGSIEPDEEVAFDYPMVQLKFNDINKDSIFNGIQYYAADASNLDTVYFQVVYIAPDGNAYIGEEFGEKVFIMPNSKTDILLYESKIVPGLHIRCIYKNNGTKTAYLSMNLFRHLKE